MENSKTYNTEKKQKNKAVCYIYNTKKKKKKTKKENPLVFDILRFFFSYLFTTTSIFFQGCISSHSLLYTVRTTHSTF